MAIIPEDKYPGKINQANPDYPYGSARNVTAPRDGTGTPLEAAWVNDTLGFQQALLIEAGITPTGRPDKVGDSQYLDALKATSYRSAVYSTVSDLKSRSDFIASLSDDTQVSVATISYYDGWAAYVEPIGGASYTITTIDNIRNTKGDASWIPDGFADHFLLGGNKYVAMLDVSNGVSVWSCGAKIVGVDSNGNDNVNALLSAWNKAKEFFKTGSVNSVPVSNRIEITLNNVELVLSETFNVPELSSGITLSNGTITASDSFPAAEPLIKMNNDNKNIDFQYLTFENLTLNCRHLSSGIYTNKYLKQLFSNINIVKFNGFGIRSGNWADYDGSSSNYPNRGDGSDGHEMQIVNSTIEEYDYSERFAGSKASGVAIDLNNPDNTISGVVISSAGTGVRVSVTPNQIDRCHFYGIDQGSGVLHHKTNGGYLPISNCYFDECKFKAEDVSQVSVVGSVFLGGYKVESEEKVQFFEFSGVDNTGEIKERSISITNNTFNVSKDNSILIDTTGNYTDKGRYLSNQNINNNNYYDFKPIKKIETSSGNLDSEYTYNNVDTFYFDVKNYMKLGLQQNTSTLPIQILITSNWQANTSTKWGAYIATIVILSNDKYYAKFYPVDGNTTSIQDGFKSTPKMSEGGVLTIELDEFYMGSVGRIGESHKYNPYI